MSTMPNVSSNRRLKNVAQQFVQNGALASVEPFGAGNVNDTYLVNTTNQERFILQRINQQVFHHPQRIAENLRVFTAHVQQKLTSETHHADGRRPWETPHVVCTTSGDDFWEDDNGEFWRALTFIENAQTHPAILNPDHALEAGYALARFHGLVSDLNPTRLHDTLEGFHITPQYLTYFDKIYAGLASGSVAKQMANQGNNRAADRVGDATSRVETAAKLTDPVVALGLDYIKQNRHKAHILEEAKAQTILSQRAIHGDPKVDNIMIDNVSRKAVSIVDLDTVKPGLVHYDVGDCLRSCCNPLGEETDKFDQIRFETDLCQIILNGYLPVARAFFDEADYAYIYDCIWLIAFELGLRFFTDYLAGDVYFKARFPTNNLQRGIVQFKLAESIAAQEKEIRQIVASLR